MRTLDESIVAMAEVSAQRKYDNYMSGAPIARGFDPELISITLSHVYKCNEWDIYKELIPAEKKAYDKLRGANG
ncbi:hypothetical protein VPHD148_0163 [Vibrio phage D148]